MGGDLADLPISLPAVKLVDGALRPFAQARRAGARCRTSAAPSHDVLKKITASEVGSRHFFSLPGRFVVCFYSMMID